MHLVARVDALRRVPHRKIPPAAQAGFPLKDRYADIFGHARVHGGFINHHRAFFHVRAHHGGGIFQGRKIRVSVFVDRSGNGHNENIRFGQACGVGSEFQVCLGKFRPVDFPGPVCAGTQGVHALFTAIVSDHLHVASQPHGQRQPHIAQTYQGHTGLPCKQRFH